MIRKIKKIAKYAYGRFLLFTSVTLIVSIGITYTAKEFDPLAIALVLLIAALWLIGYVCYVREKELDDKE